MCPPDDSLSPLTSTPLQERSVLNRRSALKGLVGLSTAPLLASCTLTSLFERTPKPGTLSWTIQATPSVNPDISDRPSPIWVRLYQLRSIGVFGGVAFQPLFDGDIDVLGAEMLQRYEYVISPNQVIAPAPTPTPLHEDTRYIGVIAAYHDIDRAFWRDSVAVSSTGVDYSLTIQVDRLAIRLTLVKD